nr:hypothetical protein CFP56_25882 [Quercus suber]
MNSANSSNNSDSQQSAAAPHHGARHASKVQLALGIQEIREHVLFYLDPLSLVKAMRVSRAWRVSTERKVLQVHLFLSPVETSTVWIINHDAHTVEHKTERVRPLKNALIHGSAARENMTGLEDLAPLRLNPLLFPGDTSTVKGKVALFGQVFHKRHGPAESKFLLGVVPLGIGREQSCKKMLITQPPVVDVVANWAFLIRGEELNEAVRSIYRFVGREHILNAETTRDWTLIDLHGNPMKLEDEDPRYQVLEIRSSIANPQGVRFNDLCVDLYHQMTKLANEGKDVIALLCYCPPPVHATSCSISASNIGIHGLFPTTIERNNVESFEKCQGPWGLPDEDPEGQSRWEWIGQSLNKPVSGAEEFVWSSNDE